MKINTGEEAKKTSWEELAVSDESRLKRGFHPRVHSQANNILPYPALPEGGVLPYLKEAFCPT